MFTEVWWAINELEDWWFEKARSRARLNDFPAYTNGKRVPAIFVGETDTGNLEVMTGTPHWPRLREAVSGWRRFNTDDHLAFQVEQRLEGRKRPTMEAAWIGTIVRAPGTMAPCSPRTRKSRRA